MRVTSKKKLPCCNLTISKKKNREIKNQKSLIYFPVKGSSAAGNEQKFMGEGQMFKGKLIGVLEVQEARGDRMCQDALAELKTAIKASGEHKQRILIHIAVDGLKIRDEKSGVRFIKFYSEGFFLGL